MALLTRPSIALSNLKPMPLLQDIGTFHRSMASTPLGKTITSSGLF